MMWLVRRAKESLLVAAAKQRLEKPPESEMDKIAHEEADIMRHMMQKQALKSAKEIAKVQCGAGRGLPIGQWGPNYPDMALITVITLIHSNHPNYPRLPPLSPPP